MPGAKHLTKLVITAERGHARGVGVGDLAVDQHPAYGRVVAPNDAREPVKLLHRGLVESLDLAIEGLGIDDHEIRASADLEPPSVEPEPITDLRAEPMDGAL